MNHDPRSSFPAAVGNRRAALRLASRWRRHEALSAWRRFRAHPLRDRLAVTLGVPSIACYAFATAAAALHRDRAPLLGHPLATASVLAVLDAGLAFAAAVLHHARSRKRLGASWLAVLPLGTAAIRRLAAADACLLLGPFLAISLFSQGALLILAGLGRALPVLLAGACVGVAAGLVPAFRLRASSDPASSARVSASRGRTFSPSSGIRRPGFAPLRALDRLAPRNLSCWCARLNRAGIRTPFLLSLLFGWLLFGLAAARIPAALPATVVLSGVAAFAAAMRSAPLASPVLRSLPFSYPRLLLGATRVPLALSLVAALPLAAAAAPLAPSATARLAAPPALVCLLDATYAVFAAHLPGRNGLAVGAWTATAALTVYEWPRFGPCTLLLPSAILALMVRRGLRTLPFARRTRRRPA